MNITHSTIIIMDLVKKQENSLVSLFRKRFGERLKSIIKNSPYNQSSLADEIGLAAPNVSRWVNGENYPDDNHYAKLKKHLNIRDDAFDDIMPMGSEQYKSDLIIDIIKLLPNLNEAQLRSFLAFTSRQATGVPLIDATANDSPGTNLEKKT